MIYRETTEKRECDTLSRYAMKACQTKGRDVPEPPCSVRTEFQRDRDRIIHSKSFRRLMHKTQVFLAPERDHFRTRLTHTIEVSQIARTIARALLLNEDLTEAIAMGHDLGHTPFGHNGESVLNEIHPCGFKHNEQSLRVVEVLESNNNKRGMNLTREVRDGILNHTGPVKPLTLEGRIVKISDRIAYINHDIDDAIRSGVITVGDLPAACIAALGKTHGERIDTLVKDIAVHSFDRDDIIMSEENLVHMNVLRDFMFANVYYNGKVKKEEELTQVRDIIVFLYRHFSAWPEQLPAELQAMIDEFGIPEIVKDYIAGMTDRFAINTYRELQNAESRK